MGKVWKSMLFLSIIIIFNVVNIASFADQPSRTMFNTGVVSDGSARAPTIFVTINSSILIGVNNLSLGFQLDHEWKTWRDSSVQRELTGNAGFKLVRVFDYKSSSPHPCIYWNESTITGTFNWTDLDLLVQRIFETGAEPMFCLGSYTYDAPKVPLGMAVNPDTKLPYPESFAAYASEWVKHFRNVGLPVRFYEIWNEAWNYFFDAWGIGNPIRLSNFVSLFNVTSRSMLQIDSNVLLGTDSSTFKCFLNYLMQYKVGLGFLSLHKYDSSSTNTSSPEYCNDADLMSRATQWYFEENDAEYGVAQARQIWYYTYGVYLPVILSEINLNSAWTSGTDPRIQKMIGAVWTALTLETCVLKDVQYSIYYTLLSSASEESKQLTKGYGFGMVNLDNNEPWNIYFVHQMLGNNLGMGDTLVYSSSSSAEISALAWVHNGEPRILLICQSNKTGTVILQGLDGLLNLLKIDDAVSWQTPRIKILSINASKPLTIDGYTVALLGPE